VVAVLDDLVEKAIINNARVEKITLTTSGLLKLFGTMSGIAGLVVLALAAWFFVKAQLEVPGLREPTLEAAWMLCILAAPLFLFSGGMIWAARRVRQNLAQGHTHSPPTDQKGI
jgi:hypothetical protein